MVRVKSYSNFLIVLICLGWLTCREKEKIEATIVPPIKGATLHFRGYVSYNQEELASDIYNFSRSFSHNDTLDGQPVYVYSSQDDKIPYYTDEAGTVRQLNTINLTNRLIPYNITTTTRRPVIIRYWETLLKQDNGIGTEWHVLVDTTIVANDKNGKTVQIRYFYSGRARYEGMNPAFIPEPYKYVPVLDVHWYEIENYIVNQTTMDSLFVRRGTAHHFFDPELGLIKYITDYKKKELNQAYVLLHGTWELVAKELPR